MQHPTVQSHPMARIVAIAGLGLFMWALPLSHTLIPTHLSGHDHARLAQLFVFAAVSLYWAWTTTRNVVASRCSVDARQVAFLFAVAMLVGASTLNAAYPLIAAREVLVFAGLLVLSNAIATLLVRREYFSLLLRTLVLGVLIYAGAVLTLMAITLFAGGHFDPWVALIGFDSPRFLNHAQTAALPLLTVVAVSDLDVRWRRAAVLALVFSGMLLFLTYGRATMLALAVGLATARWAFGRRANAYAVRALVPALFGMGLMWLIYLQWMQSAGYNIAVDELTRPHHRGHLVRQAIKLWEMSPWLGVGPMHFSHWEDGDAAHPHNIYAQVLAEYGALTALLLIGGAAIWMVRHLQALRQMSPPHAFMAIGLWGALVGVAVDGGFSGNFVMPVSQLWIALTVGLVKAFVSVHGQGPGHHNGAGGPLGLAGKVTSTAVSWLLAVGLCWLALQSALLCCRTPFPSMETSGPIQGEWRVVTTVNPRFWSTGFF